MRETVGPKPGQDPIAHYLGVLSDKTGSLIALAAEMGIRMSGGPEELVAPIRRFGEKIGVAFQLVDDVIDLSERGSGTGKPPGTDVRRGVTTLPMLFLHQDAASDPDARALLERLARGTAGEAEDEEFQEDMAQTRVFEAVNALRQNTLLYEQYACECKAWLPSLHFPIPFLFIFCLFFS
jgi:heptaprenyl diphosphate synthase